MPTVTLPRAIKELRATVTAVLILCSHLCLWSQGIPYFRNFTSTEYAAHNQNFDIVADDDGTVYVANFEGLLYYDNAQWRIIHTTGITRVTSLFRDSKGTLWTGGYNYIGQLDTNAKGELTLKDIAQGKNSVRGEVTNIWEADGQVYMRLSDESCYILSDTTITPTTAISVPTPSTPPIQEKHIINQTLEVDFGLKVIATNGEGIILVSESGKELCHIKEDDGLCSNNIIRLAYNGHGLLWGATDNGIFAMHIPSAYTSLTPYEGLRGEVLSLAQMHETIYAGTSGGLFYLHGMRFFPVKGIGLACWQLLTQGDRLLAATADGLYTIDQNNNVSQLTTANTMTLFTTGEDILTGEMDGVYILRNGRQREKLWDTEKVVRIVSDDNATLWLQNLYGSVWHIPTTALVSRDLQSLRNHKPIPLTSYDKEEINTLVSYKGQVTPVAVNGQLSMVNTERVPYPLFSYADGHGLLWLTDNKGKSLYAIRDSLRDEKMSRLVYPLMDYSVRAMMRCGEQLWIGGDKGINIVDNGFEDPVSTVIPQLLIRSVMLHGDSVIWGGYGQRPDVLPPFDNSENHVVFTFSTVVPSLLLMTQYRTRLNGGNWSAWETLTTEEYSNLTYGDFRFEVQARDAFGRMTDIVSMDFSIKPPFYLRWYMVLLYIALLIAIIYALMKFRLYRLEKDKHRLEAVVSERTADLIKAQHKLVRQEKMATVGKLTQGLIDRILNPLNYINNFAKLSENLVKDAIANIEDEKENMTPDNYDDTIDVLSMLQGNLQKVGEHGANTARILKAMEEMLKDRTGGQTDMSLTAMLKNNEQMLQKYYAKEIADHNIKTTFALPTEEVHIKGNAELLSLTIMSILRNAIYAVVKKNTRLSALPEETRTGNYTPAVTLTLTVSDGKAIITIHDNGTGIESTIINRIFDPFFTTKTTGEASGIGLYIGREIVQNHSGDITASSTKNEFTEFTITLPTSHT